MRTAGVFYWLFASGGGGSGSLDGTFFPDSHNISTQIKVIIMATVHRRKFSDDEKRSILGEANKRGVNLVLREHNLSYSVFSRWKAKFDTINNPQPSRTKLLRQIKELTKENDHLKRLVANLALEIQVKADRRTT